VSDAASALYYTFSTIAQSLAAAIALLGAFVLYRLQTLNAEIERRSDALLGKVTAAKDQSEMTEAAAKRDFASVFEMSSVRLTVPDRQVDYARRRLKALLNHERSLMRWFWVATFLTVGLITASVIVLSRTPWICSLPDGATISLDVGIGWFLACLGSYALLLQRALSSSDHHEN
jgi:hypothetical protein